MNIEVFIIKIYIMRNRLTERDLSRIVRRVINEEEEGDGKSELIQVLTDKLNNMKNDTEYDATDVAQIIYNNCAHFMNKTDIFSSRSGEPLSSKAPFAPKE